MYVLGKMSRAGLYLYPAATVICFADPTRLWKLQGSLTTYRNTALVGEICLIPNLVGFHCNWEARISLQVCWFYISFQYDHLLTQHHLVKYYYFGKIVRSSHCQSEFDFLNNILMDDIASLCKVTNLFLSRSYLNQTQWEYFSCNEKWQQLGMNQAHPERSIHRGNPFPKFPQFHFEIIVSHLLPANFIW